MVAVIIIIIIVVVIKCKCYPCFIQMIYCSRSVSAVLCNNAAVRVLT